MAKRKRGEQYIFTVEGSGTFPFDMLRYDACWPYNEGHDSPNVAAHPSTGNDGLRRVVLQSAQEAGPTPGRWESLGWTVIGEGELRNPMLRPTPLRRTDR